MLFRSLTRSLKITVVTMPALSPTMSVGTLVAWKKKVGDAIQPGEVLADVGTDKATLDFENVADEGFMARHMVPDGTAGINVGDVIALLVDEKSSVASPEVAAYKAKGAALPPTPTVVVEAPKSTVHHTTPMWLDRSGPAARVAYLSLPSALREGLSLEDGKGSGHHGRVTKEDVARAAAGGAPPSPPKAQQAPSGPAAPPAVPVVRRWTPPRNVVVITNFTLSDAAVLSQLLKQI